SMTFLTVNSLLTYAPTPSSALKILITIPTVSTMRKPPPPQPHPPRLGRNPRPSERPFHSHRVDHSRGRTCRHARASGGHGPGTRGSRRRTASPDSPLRAGSL